MKIELSMEHVGFGNSDSKQLSANALENVQEKNKIQIDEQSSNCTIGNEAISLNAGMQNEKLVPSQQIIKQPISASSNYGKYENTLANNKLRANGLRTSKFAKRLDIFMQEKHEIKWLVKNMMPQQCFIILSAKSKTRKTYFTFNLALALSKGKNFLGKKTEKIKTLIVQLEDPYFEIQRKFNQMSTSSDKAIYYKNIYVKSCSNFNERTLLEIENFVKEHEIGLIIVDPMVYAMKCRENDSFEVAQFTHNIKRLIRKMKCSILFVHHNRKAEGEPEDAIRGSSVIFGAVDSAIIIQKEDKSVFTMTVGGRSVARYQEIIRFNELTGWWEIIGTSEDYRNLKLKIEIIEILEREGPEVDIKTLCDRLCLSHRSFRQALKELVSDEFVLQAYGAVGERGGRPKLLYSANEEKLQDNNSSLEDILINRRVFGDPIEDGFDSENLERQEVDINYI